MLWYGDRFVMDKSILKGEVERKNILNDFQHSHNETAFR